MGKRTKKQRKPKLSKIKRNNQMKAKLSKQGKLKTRRHKPSKKQPQKPAPQRPETVEEEESDNADDLMDMIEEDDLNFLKEAISNKSYSMLRRIRLPETEKESKCKDQNGQKKEKKIKKDRSIEELYENRSSAIMKREAGKSVRMLLPIKTQNGIVKKHVIEES